MQWISNATKRHTLPVVIFTIWTDPSLEPESARVEVEFIVKHVNPSVWYGWPRKQTLECYQKKIKEKRKFADERKIIRFLWNYHDMMYIKFYLMNGVPTSYKKNRYNMHVKLLLIDLKSCSNYILSFFLVENSRICFQNKITTESCNTTNYLDWRHE